ncbi:MAG: DUF4241 domain-containing protein, partial [Flavitalea sp.]
VVSNEPIDTLNISSKVRIEPALLEKAFIAGTRQYVNKNEFHLYGTEIGTINIPSGRLIACDPLHVDEYGIPFTQQFPKGEFPVQLAIASIGGEEKVAFARVLFSDAPVTRWQMATTGDQQSLPIGGEEIVGFSVDGSTAIYMDEVVKKSFDPKLAENYSSPLFLAMDKHYRRRWRFAMFPIGEHKVAAFNTGMGDGYFASYTGFDSTGQVCRLTTDFNIFEWRQKEQ